MYGINEIELFVYTNITDGEGNVIKALKSKILINKDDFDVQEYVSPRTLKISKTKCIIYRKDRNEYQICHGSYQSIKDKKQKRNKIGFQTKIKSKH